MQFFHDHILSIILFTPLVGIVPLLFIPGSNKQAIRWWANIAMFAGFVVSLPLVFWFPNEDPTAQFKFIEQHSWIPSIGAQYFLGIDGISFQVIMLTTVLGFLSVLSSWTAIEDRAKEYYAVFLLLQTGMLGVFMSLDFFLFYVFWEVMLVPMYFIIGVWGGPRKLYAAIKFFLYTLAGSVLMLLGILTLYFRYHTDTGVYTFNVLELMKHSSAWPEQLQFWVFWAFMIGFAIKVPMFPFHTWLPDAHVEAPTAGSVILAGVLLKMGTYGFIRFSLPLLPKASTNPTIVKVMVTLSIIGIVYGALVSLVQRDMKKLVAYSSVSHLGFCTLGIFALNPHGLSGSIIQQINHGISTGALFLIVGLIYERRHTREIKEFGGLSNRRVHHPAGRVRGELALGRLGGIGHRSRSRLSPLALPADHVRDRRQSQEPGAQGSEFSRGHDAGAADHLGLLDRSVPQAVFQRAREAGDRHRPGVEAGLLQCAGQRQRVSVRVERGQFGGRACLTRP